jgi:hypothetical protein
LTDQNDGFFLRRLRLLEETAKSDRSRNPREGGDLVLRRDSGDYQIPAFAGISMVRVASISFNQKGRSAPV